MCWCSASLPATQEYFGAWRRRASATCTWIGLTRNRAEVIEVFTSGQEPVFSFRSRWRLLV